MKTLIIMSTILASSVAFGTTFQCPASLSCKYLNGATTCQSLPSGWEVIQTLPSSCSAYVTFSKIGSYYDTQASTYNGVKCEYFLTTSGCASMPSISINPNQEQPTFYPDMSEQFGWVWDTADKSAAHCSSGACLFTTVAPQNH